MESRRVKRMCMIRWGGCPRVRTPASTAKFPQSIIPPFQILYEVVSALSVLCKVLYLLATIAIPPLLTFTSQGTTPHRTCTSTARCSSYQILLLLLRRCRAARHSLPRQPSPSVSSLDSSTSVWLRCRQDASSCLPGPDPTELHPPFALHLLRLHQPTHHRWIRPSAGRQLPFFFRWAPSNLLHRSITVSPGIHSYMIIASRHPS
ncbi:hypothetical protein BKA65DRAFT_253267 [Rhexocercosporidium sp. MPI-PUGE-AT-0058]|nr:hypothetical protein BKA65DRAFT_253267 [Rhexocercosporidium sp. MPI-PUGE-AT-0058]